MPFPEVPGISKGSAGGTQRAHSVSPFQKKSVRRSFSMADQMIQEEEEAHGVGRRGVYRRKKRRIE